MAQDVQMYHSSILDERKRSVPEAEKASDSRSDQLKIRQRHLKLLHN